MSSPLTLVQCVSGAAQEAGRLAACTQAVVNISDDALWNLLSCLLQHRRAGHPGLHVGTVVGMEHNINVFKKPSFSLCFGTCGRVRQR